MMEPDLYAVLGLERTATKSPSSTEIRRAYRTLCTRTHPDKEGGDAARFQLVQLAYAVLSNPTKRLDYDTTGTYSRAADEEFVEQFAKGAFKDPRADAESAANDVADQIILHQGEAGKPGSHTAGFKAWLRSRGQEAQDVFDAEAAARQFGVVKNSYQVVPLVPCDIMEVKCTGTGRPKDVLVLSASSLPPALEWGQVLVDLQMAPINPADLYTARLGGVYGSEALSGPFVAGHDGVGCIAKVGPGVKHLQEGDIVLPALPLMGTWRSKAVWLERDLIPVKDVGLPSSYLALSKDMCLAYCLLERHTFLKPGDAVILNAANSFVGDMVIQLCRLLKLRVIAVVREPSTQMLDHLRSIGATCVLKDEGSLKLELEKLKFFAKPKLALDSVGAESGLRLADALAEGGVLVPYGCMSGKSPTYSWQSFVFKELKVTGFNFRRWLQEEGLKGGRFVMMLGSISRLVAANLINLSFTEYHLTEFDEALEHAMASGKTSKVIIKMS